MSNATLTTEAFWTNYWLSKQDGITEVKGTDPINQKILDLAKNNQCNSIVEIGGFPGIFTVPLAKLGFKTTLIDYVIVQEYLETFFAVNKVEPNLIEVLQRDIFNDVNPNTYDLVFSVGLIEHFENTKDIILQHVKYVNKNGILYLVLPNFRGINGWLQRMFDPENYKVHHIPSMDLALLYAIFTELNFEVKECNYFGGFTVWLENKTTKSLLAKITLKTIWIFGKVASKVFKLKGKWFSPYIGIYGIKK